MKKFIPAIVVVIFPYSILFVIYCIFSGFLMKTVFDNNVYLCLLFLIALWVLSLICAILICVISRVQRWDSFEVVRISMLIKLIQIPAYVLIFLIGSVCLFTIFTFAISFVLMLLDCMAILLSGLIGISAVKRSHTEGVLSTKELFIHGILQFIFCADVVSSVIVFRKTKLAKGRF